MNNKKEREKDKEQTHQEKPGGQREPKQIKRSFCSAEVAPSLASNKISYGQKHTRLSHEVIRHNAIYPR